MFCCTENNLKRVSISFAASPFPTPPKCRWIPIRPKLRLPVLKLHLISFPSTPKWVTDYAGQISIWRCSRSCHPFHKDTKYFHSCPFHRYLSKLLRRDILGTYSRAQYTLHLARSSIIMESSLNVDGFQTIVYGHHKFIVPNISSRICQKPAFHSSARGK